MRKAFIKALSEEAIKNEKIFLLTADLGYKVVETFSEKFPNRFINMGVAEANMMAVAAGLALAGKNPFTYSISTFITMRCFEQIRNDVCIQNTNVKIVGVGGGLQYGPAGPTHHALEDIALMRALPNMTVLCPADPNEAYSLTKLAISTKGPVYLRLGKGDDKVIYEDFPKIKVGKGVVLREGKSAALIATGSMVATAIEIHDNLIKSGVKITVIDMHTVKPLDNQLILETAKKTKNIYTLEEHHIIGGLGSAVAEVLAENSLSNINFKRLGVEDRTYDFVGSQEYLRERFSLSSSKVTKFILENQKSHD